MKKIVLILLTVSFLFSACDQNADYYEKGYRDAWNGDKNVLFYYAQSEYKRGHAVALNEMRDYRNFQLMVNKTKRDMSKAVDDLSASVEDLRKKVEQWGEEQSSE